MTTFAANKKPSVSIIIPTHNMARFIGEAIKSVLAQTFQDFEIIVVDDASTDNTAQVISKIQDSRLNYLFHQKNRGPSAARNTGIGAAKGEFIALLDADDLWLPTKLCKQLSLFQQDPNLGIVYCGAYEVDTTSQILRKYIPQKAWPKAGAEAFERIARRDDFIIAPLSSMTMRKACFDEVGLFDEQIVQAEEWDWTFRIAYKWNINFVPEPLVYYRMTGHFMPEKRLGRRLEEAHLTIIRRGFEQVNSDTQWHSLKQELLVRTLWGTALYWYAVKKPDKAQQNLAQIAINSPDFLNFIHNPALLESIAYTAWGLYDTITPIDKALTYVNFVFAHLPEIVRSSQKMRKKTMAKVCAICAFDSYPRGEIQQVWKAVIQTLYYNPTWVTNIGLLKLPFKVVQKKHISS
ncbi:MAG: glycosyltransferase family 2 protein [Anaerolineae bacterium]|nr:glycosyltransferase family 2 protein [Anaerolineae bacterium]